MQQIEIYARPYTLSHFIVINLMLMHTQPTYTCNDTVREPFSGQLIAAILSDWSPKLSAKALWKPVSQSTVAKTTPFNRYDSVSLITRLLIACIDRKFVWFLPLTCSMLKSLLRCRSFYQYDIAVWAIRECLLILHNIYIYAQCIKAKWMRMLIITSRYISLI